MTRRAPSFARAFTGRWRITEMDEWDEIDLAGSALVTFSGKDHGKLAFLAVDADLDVSSFDTETAAEAWIALHKTHIEGQSKSGMIFRRSKPTAAG